MIGLLAAGAGIGLAGSALKSGMDYGFSSLNWNKQVAQEQSTYQRNRADYLHDLASERAYNSPAAMIDRIRDAGLNPNLMNGGQLVSAQASSGASPMPMGSQMSPDPVRSDSITSGLPAFSNAIANKMETNSRIAYMETQIEYQKIINKYQDEASALGNKVTAARYDEIMQGIQESLSRVNLNNSTIEVNGKKIDLMDSEIMRNLKESDRLVAEKALTEVKTTLSRLDAVKAQILLPYVGKAEAARIALMKAQTDKEQAAAASLVAKANLDIVDTAIKQGLVDAGYCQSYVNQLNSQIEYAEKTGNASVLSSLVGVKNAKTSEFNAWINQMNALTNQQNANTLETKMWIDGVNNFIGNFTSMFHFGFK